MSNATGSILFTKVLLVSIGLTVLIPTKAIAQWRMVDFVNEFGDVTGRGAVSATVSSIRPMSFPYHDTKATIYVDCSQVWIRFTDVPNLTDGTNVDGETVYSVVVRSYDSDIVRDNNSFFVSQDDGDKDLRFIRNQLMLSWISDRSNIAISFPWHGQGRVAFRWSLNGSSKMIKDSCE